MTKRIHIPDQNHLQVINRISSAFLILAFAWLGTSYIRTSNAEATTASLSPASGTITGNAKVINDVGGASSSAIEFGPGATSTQVCQKVAIPAYYDPTWSGSPWATATADAPGVGIMIINLDNGPGTTVNSDYPSAIASAKAAGIRVLGYVDTAYGNDSITSVETQVDEWRTLYGVTDIMFDEASSNAAQEPYYQQLTAYVHSQTAGSITMINPGAVPDPSYADAADIISIFEGSYATYMQTTFPSWIHNYPPTKFVNVIYDVPNAADMQSALAQSETDNAGYVFATDAGLPNPYDVNPTFLSQEAAVARNDCSF